MNIVFYSHLEKGKKTYDIILTSSIYEFYSKNLNLFCIFVKFTFILYTGIRYNTHGQE